MRDIAATGLSDNLEDGNLREDGPGPLSPEDADTVLVMARQLLGDSESYIDIGHRAQIDRNHANFRSEHPKGSKYETPAYKHRSKLHKPKTRATAERAMAAFSAAFFSTQDVTSITAEDEDDPELAAGARTWHEALEYRLRESIRWKQTVIGAAQNAWVEGICITRQYWDFRRDADGDVTHDQPAVDLVPLGKFRFSSHADWRDVVRTSNYLIEEINPTVGRVLDDMMPGPNGEPPRYRPCAASVVAASSGGATKKAPSNRGDEEETETVELHKEARIFRFIVERGGVDWEFHMLGETHLLTNPTRLKDFMPQAMRPYAVGGVTIESHRAIPQSKVEIGQALQAEINSVANNRQDNVQLAMRKHFVANKDSGIDMASMLRFAPGGVTRAHDINGVKELEIRDVTASAYKEEESLAAAYDEIMGSFSQQSANTNSNIGRTATGLELIASDSNIMTEFAVEIFATTWMQDALRQILILMQTYETDALVIGEAMKKADIMTRYGIPPEMAMQSERLLRTPARLRINVGVDATNPERKVLKMRNFVQLAVELGKQINSDEVLKETAGAMGYDDGERFIEIPPEQQQGGEDPAAAAEAAKAQVENGKLQIAQQKMQQDGELAMQRLQLDHKRIEIDMAKVSQAQEMARERAQLDMQREQIKAQMQQLGIQSAEEIALMQDGTTREIAMLTADTARQNAILQGQTTEAIAMQRDQTERDKAKAGFAEQREARSESNDIARQGLQQKQEQAKRPDPER